mgnify:CR=1 FL=1
MSTKYRRPLTTISYWVTTSNAQTDFTTHSKAASAGLSHPGSAARMRASARRAGMLSLCWRHCVSLTSISDLAPCARSRHSSCEKMSKDDCLFSTIQIPTNALRDSDQQAIRTAASMTPSARTPPTLCTSLSRGETTDHRTETPGTRTPAARTARRGLLPRRERAQTNTSGFASHRGIPREASELAPTNTRSPLPNAWTARRRARATVIHVRQGVSRRRMSSTRT